MANKVAKKVDPMKTKTGKLHLGPLSLAQLNDLLSKTSKAKIAAQIRNRISVMLARAVAVDLNSKEMSLL